jgi:hypothetical protein
MAFIEVGATDSATGALFPSKAAIRRAWTADPQSVRFTSVASVVAPRDGQAFNGPVSTPADLPENTKLMLVGPDPYRQRNYYGTVEVKKGKIVIS